LTHDAAIAATSPTCSPASSMMCVRIKYIDQIAFWEQCCEMGNKTIILRWSIRVWLFAGQQLYKNNTKAKNITLLGGSPSVIVHGI
jgi:hypothetical protein